MEMMKVINPLDHQLDEAKKIVAALKDDGKPRFIIYRYHEQIDYIERILPIAVNIMRKKGFNVASHAIYSRNIDNIETYLNIQDSNVAYISKIMVEDFPLDTFDKVLKLLYGLNYSLITCIPSFNDLSSDKLELVEKIGFNVEIIKGELLHPKSLISGPEASAEALSYENISRLYKSDLSHINLSLKEYHELLESISYKKYDDFVSRGDGIYKASTDLEIDLAEKLSILSQMESCWESPLITREGISDGIIVYLYIENGMAKGFAVFEKKPMTDPSTGVKSEIIMIGEIYTCPKFRKKGIANELLDYGIKDLKIDTEPLHVSAPVMPGAQKIIADRIGDNIVLNEDGRFKWVSKESIKRYWGLF